MPILMYHSIGDKTDEVGTELYCVPVAAFRQQMEYLRGKDAVITFDDGDMTNYAKAYPILKEMGLRAYFFIIGEWIGKPGYMSWKEIKELKDSGMVIGSHGMTHRILTTLKENELDYELRESKKILEDNLKISVKVLSIPRGFCNKEIIDKALLVGYEEVFTSRERIAVRADWDMTRFVNALNANYLWQDRVADFVKFSSKKMLGDKNYDRLRARILR